MQQENWGRAWLLARVNATDEKSGREPRGDMLKPSVELLSEGGALSPQELAWAELIVTERRRERLPAQRDAVMACSVARYWARRGPPIATARRAAASASSLRSSSSRA